MTIQKTPAGYRAPTVFGCGHVAQEQQHNIENMLFMMGHTIDVRMIHQNATRVRIHTYSVTHTMTRVQDARHRVGDE